jgi:hypothetical protein
MNEKHSREQEAVALTSVSNLWLASAISSVVRVRFVILMKSQRKEEGWMSVGQTCMQIFLKKLLPWRFAKQ